MKKVLISFIQDRSGSMSGAWTETLNGFKTYVEKLQADKEADVEYNSPMTAVIHGTDHTSDPRATDNKIAKIEAELGSLNDMITSTRASIAEETDRDDRQSMRDMLNRMLDGRNELQTKLGRLKDLIKLPERTGRAPCSVVRIWPIPTQTYYSQGIKSR